MPEPAELLYPGAAGCAASVPVGAGQPGPCGASPVGTVHHRYREQVTRRFVCTAHKDGHPGFKPLDDTARAELDRRRREQAEAYARRDANRT